LQVSSYPSYTNKNKPDSEILGFKIYSSLEADLNRFEVKFEEIGEENA